MVKRETALKIRKAHRYLGIFLGLQFFIVDHQRSLFQLD